MPESRRRFLAAVGASLAIAGCQNDGGGAEPTDTPEQTDVPDGNGGGGTTVQVRDHDEYGEILVDSEGMTLYMFDSDEQGAGESTCTGGCIDNWPLLTVEDGEATAGDGVEAELTTFEHSETGETQVAANGWPLYYFTPDQAPGDANGQGVSDVWWVLRPDGTPVRASSTATPTEAAAADVQVATHEDHGDILVDSEGMTLYMFDSDTQGDGASTCTGGCLDNWPVLSTEGDPSAGEDVTAALTTFEHSETGDTQVAANGWPLYYFAGDSAPGDANGQGVSDVWWVLDPSGAPIRSSSENATASPTPTETATESDDSGGIY